MFYKGSILLVIATCLIATACASYRNYDGYSVYRVVPHTMSQFRTLRSLRLNENNDQNLQFWTEPTGVNRPVDILVSPDYEENLRKKDLANFDLEQLIDDVGEIISSANETNGLLRDSLLESANMSTIQFFQNYQSYDAIANRLRNIARKPNARVHIIGESSEGRDLYLVHLSSDFQASKPAIFIDGGHHAREWISQSTAMYLIESLVDSRVPKYPERLCYSEQCRRETRKATGLDLENFDYYIIPVVNPDGYEYTRLQDRMWRKTRSKNGYCVGVDPNRNYPKFWMVSGASSNPCSDLYAGSGPLSEPETAAVAKTLMNLKGRVAMYISLHSYSTLILSPWGHRQMYPDNYRELQRVANQWIRSTRNLRQVDYEFGTSAIKLYPASGGADDYAYGEAGVRLAYTIELPDKGRHGFLLPPSEIIPVGHEAVIGLRAMSDAILQQAN